MKQRREDEGRKEVSRVSAEQKLAIPSDMKLVRGFWKFSLAETYDSGDNILSSGNDVDALAVVVVVDA